MKSTAQDAGPEIKYGLSVETHSAIVTEALGAFPMFTPDKFQKERAIWIDGAQWAASTHFDTQQSENLKTFATAYGDLELTCKQQEEKIKELESRELLHMEERNRRFINDLQSNFHVMIAAQKEKIKGLEAEVRGLRQELSAYTKL